MHYPDAHTPSQNITFRIQPIMINLVVSCGGEHLKNFMERARKNAAYTSRVAVTEIGEASGQWAQEVSLAHIHQTSVISLMADESTDISTVEELSVYSRWVEDGVPVEHFLEILPLKRKNAENIYSAILSFLREKNIQLSKLVGMGFDGAATFSGKRSGVQMRLKANVPHALFVHYHCHRLQLACVQAANNTIGIKYVYRTLTSLWKLFHYSPMRAETLKEVQQVLELP